MTDMLSLLPEGSSERYDSSYRMVIAAAQRAKQLMQGPKSSSATSKFAKETTIALEEVLQGRVNFLAGKEARQAMRDAKRIGDGDMERLATANPVAGEDAREIKKELSVYIDDSPKQPTPETEE
jgi:DNA-directed RNA polymerase subunit omega